MKIWLFSLNAGLLLIISACGDQQSSDEDSDYSTLRSTGVEKKTTADSAFTTEAGGTETVQVRLTSMPLSTVTVIPSSSDNSEGQVSPDTLSFTNENWNTYQTLTISGVDDDVTDGTQSYHIDFQLSTEDTKYSSLSLSSLSISNQDDEVAGVVVGTISGNTSESGGTATFTVKLNSQPEADVTISVSSNNSNEGTVNPSTLEFSSSNWNSSQTVTVTGVDDSSDPVVDGNTSYKINLGNTVSSSTHYNDLKSATVELSNTDSESPGVTLSSRSLTTSENGTNATFTVKLDHKTTSDVTINLQSDDPGEGSPSPSALTFTTTNYSSAQTITVQAVDDAFFDDNQSYTIALKTISGTGTAYDGFDPADVSVTNTDNESADGVGIETSTSSISVSETGSTASFTLRLKSEPTANVVLSITSSNTAEGVVSPSSLLFSRNNWSTSQTVTVTGIDDYYDNGSTSFSIIVGSPVTSDTNYSAKPASAINATNVDNDTAGITIIASDNQTGEDGDNGTLLVLLDSRPFGDVILSVTSDNTTETKVSPDNLTFTTSNWNSSQTVTLIGIDDDDNDSNQSFNITVAGSSHTTSNGETSYDNLSSSVQVTNVDNESI
tara:strand:+ start:1078 stop:2901 length:1824 start_codon:yes stop_codon:yes gene_type:complete